MEEILEKIRPHVKSGLVNQSGPAKLLVAVEATLKEQKQEGTPVAYYASFLATLQESVKRENSSSNGLDLDDGSVVPSTLYLLSLVLPHVPDPVVRSNLSSLLNTVAPLFPLVSSSAPPLRSAIGIVAAIIDALDAPHLTSSSPLPRQCFATILELIVDPRPKVRKRAQEAVLRIINSPPPPMLVHPYKKQTADFVIRVFNVVAGNPGQQDSAEMGIWLCTFTKAIASSWPSTHLDALLQPLLSLPSLSSQYLTSQAYSVLSTLLRAPTLTLPAQSILGTLLAYPPSHHTLATSWLEALENSMVAFARADAATCAEALPGVWEASWAWLESEDVRCRKAAESALCAMVRYCLTGADLRKAAESIDSVGTDSGRKKGGKIPANDGLRGTILGSIVLRLDTSLHSVAFAKATPALLSILSALISRLRLLTSAKERRVTAAEVLVPDLIVYVGSLRIAKGFEYREKADEVLGMAIRVLGPEIFLTLLPLNITPESPGKTPPAPGRAFLLPLLAHHITNTSLKHFTTYFVPLSEQLFELKVKADEGGKANEAKVWEVLIGQVWSCFKGYCEACVDLKEAFSTPFARLITNLLYTQPTLRTSILQGLRTLLQTSLTLSQSSAPPESLDVGFGISQEQAKENVEFLKSVSGNMISVLFNVFSSIPSEERGLVGDVVKTWMGVSPQKEVKNVFGKINDMLSDALSKPVPNPTNLPPIPHTMLDLLLLLFPFLPPLPASQIFDQALAQWVESSDAGVQKRSYRLLARCAESEVIAKGGMSKLHLVEKVITHMNKTTDKVAQGAKRDRIELLTVVVQALSATSQLHYLPSILPEAILATKEVSEKARTAAFDLLVAMGRKMTEEGGVVKRNLVDGIAAMDLDGDAKEVNASVEEYMTMVAAGLVGSTPHMISASITAISRLLFEFKDELPETMQNELLATVIVFLASNNREIVKSVLGFVKLCVITLPTSIVRPHLPQLVPGLLGWSHDHKNHFKVKVQHIFERMGRRFGWDSIMQHTGDENVEGRKVLENIKKRKERARKQKAKVAAARDEEDANALSEEDTVPKANTGNAFEDVLYGSDSDAEENHSCDEDPRPASKPNSSGGKGRTIAGSQKAAQQRSKNNATNRSETRIRTDGDEPMDLLNAGAANTVALNPNRRRQPGQDASHFKTDSSSGRIVIDDETFTSAPKSKDPSDDIAGQAYRDQMTGVDGFTRGPSGEVKFHKNTKKRRAEEAAAEAAYGDGGEDVEMNETRKAVDREKKKKIERVHLGQEFKAKNAGGDVKRKGQQDPYAYLPLSSIGGGKKKGGAGKVKYNITGKR